MSASALEEGGSGRRLARSTAIFSPPPASRASSASSARSSARSYFGVEGPINAFTVAFQIPNLVRALVADAALSSAFVPVFSELLEKGERKRAWRVASSLFWLMLLGLGGLTALFMLLAPLADGALRLHGAQHDLAVGLAQILFPIVVLLGVSGIVVGILNSYDHFTVPALTPVFWNLAIIVGLVLGVPHAGTETAKLYVYAVSILIGTVIQFLLPLPWLRGRDGRLRVVIDWRDPAVRRVFVADGAGHARARADQLQRGHRHVLRLALRRPEPRAERDRRGLPHLHAPAGHVLGRDRDRALPVALAARRARRHARLPRPRSALGLRQIAFLLVPASVVSAVLSRADRAAPLPARRTSRPTRRPSSRAALAAFSVGLVFNGTMLMLNRGFFSLQSPWMPTAVALGNLGLNAVLDVAFYRLRRLGHPALDLDREHRRHGRAARPAAAPDRAARRRGHPSHLRARHRSPRR